MATGCRKCVAPPTRASRAIALSLDKLSHLNLVIASSSMAPAPLSPERHVPCHREERAPFASDEAISNYPSGNCFANARSDKRVISRRAFCAEAIPTSEREIASLGSQ
jgi:hypothetical protein